MKNIYDVIRQKETELGQIQKEIDALRVAARLLTEENDLRAEGVGRLPGVTASAAASPQLSASPASAGTSSSSRPAVATLSKEATPGWEAGTRQFP